MSSTNKTANLHLNQWVATDPVLREDFNADNAALDAAFGTVPVRQLKQGTLSASSDTFQIDLSDVDFDLYREVIVEATLRAAGESADPYGYLDYYLNGVDTGFTYYAVSGAETGGTTYNVYNYLQVMWGISSRHTGTHRIRLVPQEDAVVGNTESLTRYNYSAKERISHQSLYFSNETITAATLTTLTLHAINQFAAGCRYTLYGIRK